MQSPIFGAHVHALIKNAGEGRGKKSRVGEPSITTFIDGNIWLSRMMPSCTCWREKQPQNSAYYILFFFSPSQRLVFLISCPLSQFPDMELSLSILQSLRQTTKLPSFLFGSRETTNDTAHETLKAGRERERKKKEHMRFPKPFLAFQRREKE